MEPEVTDLAVLLRKMGARIEGEGTQRITVEGVTELHGAAHAVIPDRIEAGTYVAAVVTAGGDVTIENCRPDHLESILSLFQACGLEIEETTTCVRVTMAGRPRPHDIRTAPYPHFPTDMQAQFMAAMTQADGSSTITEEIFNNRYMHAHELVRMGANIQIAGARAVVHGPTRLSGANVMATDLRASASLVVAALVADGTTVIDRVYHLDRGYERIEEKLSRLGAQIERVSH
jgi:UDP-N-acetylglucosamine 1-carboxyvinyltransferase